MGVRRSVALAAAALLAAWVVAAVVAAMAAEAPEVPEIPGITVPDPKPGGCNDCHRKVDETRDYTLAAGLRAMIAAKTHPKVSERLMVELPKQCLTCHQEGGKHPFSEVLHRAHLVGGAKNPFITRYQGQCTYCHSLDPKTGKMTVKGL